MGKKKTAVAVNSSKWNNNIELMSQQTTEIKPVNLYLSGLCI